MNPDKSVVDGNGKENIMSENLMSLNRLTMDDIDFSDARETLEKMKQTEKEYQIKYGDEWWEHYLADTNPSYGMDLDEESINKAIYNGYRLCISGHPVTVAKLEMKYQQKMKRLFGPFYKRYIRHEPDDPKVNKVLLKDALRSGKWKELPKKLQAEYHKMAGK